MKIDSLAKNFGSFGAIISAMGCASCFPVLGSLGSAIGLGFLSQFEGLFINTLLPVFAVIGLISAIFSWYFHRRHFRAFLSILAPLMILATLFIFWTSSWSTYMFYTALALMFIIAIWDLFSPAKKVCKMPQTK